MEDSLFDDYYRDTRRIAKSDMIAFLKANTAYAMKPSLPDCAASVHLYAGAKETRGIKPGKRTGPRKNTWPSTAVPKHTRN